MSAIVDHFISILVALDWMQWLLLWFLGLIPLILYMCHRAPDSFDLRHLIADPDSGKIDRFAFGYIVALVISSWLMLFYANAGKLTWEWFGLYIGVWAVPKLVEKWLDTKKVP